MASAAEPIEKKEKRSNLLDHVPGQAYKSGCGDRRGKEKKTQQIVNSRGAGGGPHYHRSESWKNGTKEAWVFVRKSGKRKKCEKRGRVY